MRLKRSGDDLLLADITITHEGHTVVIPNLVVDTGAVESLVSIDAVEEIFKGYRPDDRLHFMRGIGGIEPAIRRKVDEVRLGEYTAYGLRLDFAPMNDHPRINGLIGLDLLVPGRFIVDLVNFDLYLFSSDPRL